MDHIEDEDDGDLDITDTSFYAQPLPVSMSMYQLSECVEQREDFIDFAESMDLIQDEIDLDITDTTYDASTSEDLSSITPSESINQLEEVQKLHEESDEEFHNSYSRLPPWSRNDFIVLSAA